MSQKDEGEGRKQMLLRDEDDGRKRLFLCHEQSSKAVKSENGYWLGVRVRVVDSCPEEMEEKTKNRNQSVLQKPTDLHLLNRVCRPNC